MGEKRVIQIQNLKETEALAKKIASLCKAGDVIFLEGTLGAGKTTFSQFFIKHLTGEKDIVSPTFNLVKVYDNNNLPIYHFDLYRLNNQDELYEIGIEDALEYGVSLIEWPDLARDFVENNYLDIKISHGTNENERVFEIETFGDWEKKQI